MSNTWKSGIMPPHTNRNVLVKAEGYPDIMVANYFNGSWRTASDFCECGGIEIEVEAWKEIPTYSKPCPLTFRSADEARYLSLQTLQLEKTGLYDKDFFEVRNLIINGTAQPDVWSINIGKRPEEIINKLNDAGFLTVKEEDGTYTISWDKED